MEWIVAWGLIAISASALAAILAGIKNRDYSYWVAWSFLVPPLVLWLLLMPKNQGPAPASAAPRRYRPSRKRPVLRLLSLKRFSCLALPTTDGRLRCCQPGDRNAKR